jgi:hypothetical protein
MNADHRMDRVPEGPVIFRRPDISKLDAGINRLGDEVTKGFRG